MHWLEDRVVRWAHNGAAGVLICNGVSGVLYTICNVYGSIQAQKTEGHSYTHTMYKAYEVTPQQVQEL